MRVWANLRWLFGVVMLLLMVGSIVTAQSGTPATTLDVVNIRAAPASDAPKIGSLPINAAVTIEARNQVGNWILVSSADGQRGWVASRFMKWAEDALLANFPVSGETFGDIAAISPQEVVSQPAAQPETSASLPTNGTPARVLVESLNVRTGPESTYAAVIRLARNTDVVIEARNQFGNWLLINNGAQRGWVASRYISWDDTQTLLENIPVSGEIIGGAPTTAVAAAAPDTTTAAAPAGLQGKIIAATLNMRRGASTTETQLGTLTRNMVVAIEARNQIGDWLLVNNGSVRGWVATRFVNLGEVVLANIPVSAEVIGVTPATTNAAGGAAPALAVSGDVAAMEAQLAQVAIVPGVTNRARDLYANALRAGRNPRRFTKVGDCNSENLAFMFGFDWNNYSLGNYGGLQGTVDYFSGSFAQNSVAGKVGYSAVTVIDSLWSDPAKCKSGEAPVYCELRTSNAAFVVIMFGANDISILTPERYESAMRRIIDLSIQANSVPILSTFTTDPAQPDRWAKSLQLNLITVNLAREYDLPIINFWLAAKNLPAAGMSSDNAHLTTHSGSTIAFDGSENQFGFTMRNLVVLQTLDSMRSGLAQ